MVLVYNTQELLGPYIIHEEPKDIDFLPCFIFNSTGVYIFMYICMIMIHLSISITVKTTILQSNLLNQVIYKIL